MGEQSAISWTDHTFNPWLGCARVSPGCEHCYAEAWAKRSGLVEWGKNAERRRTSADYWKQPLKWDSAAAKAGRSALVFCASLADVFEDRPELEPWRTDLLKLICSTQNLTWLLLTKRPENVAKMLRPHGWIVGGERPDNWENAQWNGPPNVWIGTTVEDQRRANVRLPWLLSIPAPVRFASCEPLIEAVDLTRTNPLNQTDDDWPQIRQDALTGHVIGPDDIHPWHLDWVIVGGESGPGHRPFDPSWARSLRDQCAAGGVPFFFKQHGGARPTSGGAKLDGVEHHAWPCDRQANVPLTSVALP